MRSCFIYGCIVLCCLIVTTVHADIKWKTYETEEDKIRKQDEIINTNKKLEKLKSNKSKNPKFVDSNEESNEDDNNKRVTQKVEVALPKKEKSKKLAKQQDDDFSSEEKFNSKKDSNKDKKDKEKPQKKFIGRIEHGKVMVLRIKEDSYKNQNNNSIDDSEEDHNAKVCRKTKGGKNVDCDSDDDESNEDNENKTKKKIKYSIKFQHEKQKKKEKNGDSSIMRLHKNGKRYGKYIDDDDNSSDEDESPIIKKRIRYDDDD